MEEKKCKNCIYFVPIDDENAESKGQCVRYPPCTFSDKLDFNFTMWPRVNATDWCGEFKSEKLVKEISDLIMKTFSEDTEKENGYSF